MNGYIVGQIYYCGFWHCEVDKNGTMGEYEDIKSDCKSCEAKCSKDPDCDVVECDYFDSRQCTWRKQVGKQDQGCGKGERMVYSEQYKSCVKPEQGKIVIKIIKRKKYIVLIYTFD